MTRRGWLLLAAMAVIWGIPYLLIKVALEQVHPAVLVWLRVALAALVLVPLAVRARAYAPLAGRWPWVVVLATIHVVAPFLLIAYGETRIPSGLTGLLIAASPIVVAVLAQRVDPHHEPLTPSRIAGLALGLLGVGLVLGVELGGAQLLGALMVLGAAVCYAVSILVVRRHFSDVPPLGVVSAEFAIATVALTPVLLVAPLPTSPSAATIGAVLVLGLVCTALAYLLFYALIAEVGSQRASLVTYLNPAVAVALGVTLLGEPLTPAVVAGFALILGGSWLASGGRLPTRRAAPA